LKIKLQHSQQVLLLGLLPLLPLRELVIWLIKQLRIKQLGELLLKLLPKLLLILV
jgi:hypothetical protein